MKAMREVACRPVPVLRVLLVLLLAAFVTTAGCGPGEGDGEPLAPLLEGMGAHSHAITTSDPEAQRYFDQGLVLHYAFNHAEALRAFREASRRDPDCAMCFWGEALVLGPNVNAAMPAENVEPAWQAIERARELAPMATPLEEALVTALAERYSPDPDADRDALNLDYAAAMAEVVAAHPDSSDAATLWAEAQMVSSPWDYWTPEGEPRRGFGEVLGILETAMDLDPGNPGANHFYIHAVEAVRPELAVPAAERLASLVPGAGHLVHMPGHVWLRLGRYHEATLANEAAMAADEAYMRQVEDQGLYPLMYMPHNPHFLVYTASMEGRGDYAVQVADGMAARIEEHDQLASGVGTVQHYWATPMYARARFERWDEILALPAPPAGYPYLAAVHAYARGLAFARTGMSAEAETELTTLRELAAGPEIAAVTVWDLNAADSLVAIAVHVLAGEIALAVGEVAVAAEHFAAAVVVQDSLTYDEPPPWYYPVRQSLGAALMADGRAQEAETAYREDLERFPDNGWSLAGLARALESQGRIDEATEVRDRLARAWSGADRQVLAAHAS